MATSIEDGYDLSIFGRFGPLPFEARLFYIRSHSGKEISAQAYPRLWLQDYMSDPAPLAALFLTVNFDFKTLVDLPHVNPRYGITD